MISVAQVLKPKCSWPFFVLAALLSAGAARAAAAAAAQEPARKAAAAPLPARALWIFFSPAERELARELEIVREVLRKHPDVAVRPVFLTEDWAALKKPSRDFADTIKAAQALGLSLRLWDDEGLGMARDLGIGRLPAYAVVEPRDPAGVRRARVAYGYGVNVTELLR